jgi:hypothetical protein
VVAGVLSAIAVAVTIVLSIGTVVYPGSLRWTAPVLCPGDQPDAFVVRTTTTDSEGTSTSFSLFCMGDRGEFTEAGSWRPLGVLFLYTYGALLALLALLFLPVVRRGRRRRRLDRGIDPTPRPFAQL